MPGIARLLLSFGVVTLAAFLSGQAPTDEWRRAGIDAMVAEPGQAASIFTNPAGIKTREERHNIWEDREKPGKKYEWIFELASLETSMTPYLWDWLWELLTEEEEKKSLILSKLTTKLTTTLSLLPSYFKLLKGEPSGEDCECGIKDIMSRMDPEAYRILTQNTGLPEKQSELHAYQLEQLTPAQRGILKKNLLENDPRLPEAITDAVQKRFMGDLKGLGLRTYSRLLSISHTNDKYPLAWGFYFGLEQKLVFRRNTSLGSTPFSYNAKGRNGEDRSIKRNMPFGFQVYAVAPLRLAFATDFSLPGFSVGIGLKAAIYMGANQKTWGNFMSRSISESKPKASGDVIMRSMISSIGMNLGLDLGIQYRFGAITPRWEFLHIGLKISDLAGFNVPLTDNGDEFRYALDFDAGLYAEHQFPKYLQIFGGFEVIQLRGLFSGESSPYSSLSSPIEHLRFLAGLALFDNTLRVTTQYYSNNFSAGIMLNLGAFQLHAAVNLNDLLPNKSWDGSWGMNLGIRFRGPHNGFNKRTPYKTYRKESVVEPAPAEKEPAAEPPLTIELITTEEPDIRTETIIISGAEKPIEIEIEDDDTTIQIINVQNKAVEPETTYRKTEKSSVKIQQSNINGGGLWWLLLLLIPVVYLKIRRKNGS